MPFIFIFFKGTFFKNLCISCQMDGLGCFSNPSRTRGFPYQRPEPEQRKSQGLYLEPKSPIKTLRITCRKTFYMNWTQIHKSKKVHASPP